jgi:hypothetical protein
MQKEARAEHTLLVHRDEQQSLGALQGLPAVLQLVLIAWQLPPRHVPEQQSRSTLQCCPSVTQAVASHVDDVLQRNEQQSRGVLQGAPVGAQFHTAEMQRWVLASHSREQHCESEVHASPVVPHAAGAITKSTPARSDGGPASSPPSRELPLPTSATGNALQVRAAVMLCVKLAIS